MVSGFLHHGWRKEGVRSPTIAKSILDMPTTGFVAVKYITDAIRKAMANCDITFLDERQRVVLIRSHMDRQFARRCHTLA